MWEELSIVETATDKTCETCRYWSELTVRSHRSKLKPFCLNLEDRFIGYSVTVIRAAQLGSRYLGAVDDPELPDGAYDGLLIKEIGGDTGNQVAKLATWMRGSPNFTAAATRKSERVIQRSVARGEAEDWEGPAYQSCRDAAYVAASFELSRRRDNLTFSHHREVAALRAAQRPDYREQAFPAHLVSDRT